MQYTVIYNATTNRWEPHERQKEGGTWEQCRTWAFAPRLPLSFEKREHALRWIGIQVVHAQQDGFTDTHSMTLSEDRVAFESADVATLQQIWDGLWKIPVEMAWGGENMGHETIQARYLCWRKGTARIDIETEIMGHPNWKH